MLQKVEISSEFEVSETNSHLFQLFEQLIVNLRFKHRFLIDFAIDKTIVHDFKSIYKGYIFAWNPMERIVDFSNRSFSELFQVAYLIFAVFEVFSSFCSFTYVYCLSNIKTIRSLIIFYYTVYQNWFLQINHRKYPNE